MNKLTIKDITIVAVFAAILFTQEQVLTFLPNVQFTVFLIVLFSKKLGFIRTFFIVLIHVILDNLVMGSFNIMYFPFMFLGWMIIPITLCTIFKKCESPLILAILGIVFAFLYSWIYVIPNVLVLEVDPWVYLVNDFWWEIILAVSSFLSIMWLYDPCAKAIDKIMK